MSFTRSFKLGIPFFVYPKFWEARQRVLVVAMSEVFEPEERADGYADEDSCD
jgi:hypothetical protein